jgi:amidase
MARFVDDLILTLPIIAGPDWVDPHVAPAPLQDSARVNLRGLRVAMHVTNGFAPPTPATQAAVRDAARVLLGRGARVEERTPPGLAESFDLYGQIMFADGGSWMTRLAQEPGMRGGSLQPATRSRPASDLSRLIEQMDGVRSRMLSFMENIDIILCPVHSQPAVRHGGTSAPEFGRGDSYSVAFNVTGWPAASVRVAASPEGLPIGVQVVGRPWREDQVFAVAKVLEAELGGWKRPSI